MHPILKRLRPAFMGPNGLRAAWRLGIFAVVAAIATFAVDPIKVYIIVHLLPHGDGKTLEPLRLMVREFGDFSTLIVAGYAMAYIEKRPMGEYGLALRRGFRLTFWEGVVYGFGGVSLVLGALYLAGHLSLGSMLLPGGDFLYWGALFLLAFLAVALMEEYSYRGYIVYTLSTGIGFWPAALIMAVIFGYGHWDNQGETLLGVANVALFFLVFCFVLRRTGDLWMAVGFHMAWNWGEAFFYGLPDSGIPAKARLFAPTLQGSDLWTGGSAGPEASFLDPLVLLLIALLVYWRYPKVAYRPGEEMVKQPH